MNCSCEVFVLLIINLIKKKENKIISHKNCEINAQLLSSSDLFNLIFQKDTDIQYLDLFTCITLEKHAKSLNKMSSSLIMFIKKFVVIISEFFDSDIFQKVIIMIIKT